MSCVVDLPLSAPNCLWSSLPSRSLRIHCPINDPNTFDSLQCLRLTDLECSYVESLWLLCRNYRMPRRASHILIGVIYFPPNGDKLCTVNHIISCLDTVTQKHPYCGIMLCGDFNQLNDLPILSYPLKQIVTSATRRHNILDEVFTSIADWYNIPTILPPIGTSDHNVVLIHALASQPHSHPTDGTTGSCFVAVRSSDPSGKTLLAHALNRLNWVSLYKMDDCNDMLNHFYTVVVLCTSSNMLGTRRG